MKAIESVSASLSANLPSPLTSFIGRERELAELSKLLSSSRLVTLTGAGGSGKSRLALELASRRADFPDGILLAELAPLTDPVLLPQSIANVVGMPPQAARDPARALAEFLRPKQLLLILDNCEHLVEACALLADRLLHAAPNLKILATSREVLSIAGEAIFRVPPLPCPDPERIPPLEQLAQYDAVRLFVDRAASVRPSFALTESNARPISVICSRLDGIPLAIELAAARVSHVSPGEIAARLDNRFQVLTGGSRADLTHHQTLRAAIDWSYGLLTEREQTLFARLSVFAVGWSLDAAEAVCGGQVLEPLSGLINKSLISAESRDDETRYRMLETIRQYALERLEERGEHDALRQAHRHYFFALAREAPSKVFGKDEVQWLDRLEEDFGNIRAAVELTLERGEVDLGLEALGYLTALWNRGRAFGEGPEWLRRMLSLASPESPDYAEGVFHLGEMLGMSGDFDQATRLLTSALDLGRASGKHWLVARALYQLGTGAMEEGDLRQAIVYLEESLDILRRFCPDKPSIFALYHLARSKRLSGDVEGAMPYLEEGLARSKALGNKFFLGWGLGEMSHAAHDRRHLGEAIRLSKQSLALKVQSRDRAGIFYSLETLASIAFDEGLYERAARLWGAGERMRETIRNRKKPREREEIDQRIARAARPVERSAFERAWADGRGLSLEEAIDYALETPEPNDEPERTGTVRADIGRLTARERQVAGLIGQGKSNREIAKDLVVGIKTVEAHVTRILDKLGFTSRSQVAAWAVGKGFVKPPDELDIRRT